jgi:hypothetical protein
LGRGALFCVIAVAPVSVAQAASAPKDTNVAPRAQSASLSAIASKRQQLLAKMLADPSNLDVAFEYASLSSEGGDLEGAISTLERMLIYAPGLPRLDLELGVLYFRLGAYDSAQSYFDAALAAPDVPAVVKARVAPYLAAIKKQSQTDGFSGDVTVGARYQTNANSAPSSPNVLLQGLPFVLNAAGMSHADTNAFVSGDFRYVHDLASQGDKFVASLTSYGALYAHDGTLNTGVVEARVGPEFNLARFAIEDASLSTYAIVGGAIVAGNPYVGTIGAGAAIDKGLGPQAHLNVTGEYRYDGYHNSASRPTAADGTGSTFDGSATLQYQINDSLTLFAIFHGERRLAQVGYLSDWEGGVVGGATVAFASPFHADNGDWQFTVSGGYTGRQYDAPDPIVSATDRQVDREATVTGTLVVPFASAWVLQSSVSYRRTLSNYDLDNTDNVSVLTGVTRKF